MGDKRNFSEEHRRKLSEAAKRRWNTPETRKQWIYANTGRKFSDDARAKLREAQRGKKISEEHAKRLHEGSRLRWVRYRTAKAE